jgi:hypothetical protein
MHASMFPETIAKPFNRPSSASLIEALVGDAIRKSVRDEASKNKDGMQHRRYISAEALELRRANVLSVLRGLGRSFPKDVADKIPKERIEVVYNDVLLYFKNGRVDREKVMRPDGVLGYIYWAVDERQ